jgi:hypothetical protein
MSLSNEVTINVNSQLISGIISSDQYICYGVMPMALTGTPPTGGSGFENINFQWQFSDNPGGTWYDIPGANALSYQPSILWQTTYFRMIQTDTFCSPGHVVTSNIVTITVPAQVIPGSTQILSPFTGEICTGESVVLSATPPTGGSGVYSYVWQYNTGAGWQYYLSPLIGTLMYNSGPLTVSTFFRLMQLDVYCYPQQAVYTNEVYIQVISPVGQTMDSIVGSHDVCEGSQFVPYHINSASGATNYTWNLPPGATLFSGAGTNSITVNFPDFTTTGVIKVTPSNQCGEGNPSPEFPVRINPPLSGKVQLNNIIVYPGMNGCIEADTIFTGGVQGIFTVSNSAKVKLFAENAIIMQPGTSVAEGGYLLAVATNSCLSCGNFKSLVANGSHDDEIQPDEPAMGWNSNEFFRVYPNPTNGRFKLEIITDNPEIVTEIMIYNISGTVAGRSSLKGDSKMEVSLKDNPPGIYLVQVKQGEKLGMKKLVRLP